MFKYHFHGSVGVVHKDTHEEILPYQDVDVYYESRVPLDVKDPAHFALACLMVKESYSNQILQDGRLTKIGTTKIIIDLLSAGFEEVKEEPPIDISTTDRGRTILRFNDTDGYGCSLQKSSTNTEPKIWFGITHPHPVYCVEGKGWLPYPLAEGVDIPTRMHMNQEQVVKLLPYLEHFVRTGELT